MAPTCMSRLKAGKASKPGVTRKSSASQIVENRRKFDAFRLEIRRSQLVRHRRVQSAHDAGRDDVKRFPTLPITASTLFIREGGPGSRTERDFSRGTERKVQN